MSIKKFCAKPGCNQLCNMGKKYCSSHQYIEQQRQHDYDKQVRHKRDKKFSDFYKTPEWVRIRQVAIVRDKGLCQECLKQGIITLFDTVHHIVPIKVNWLLRLVLGNLICLCEKHHQIAHSELEKQSKG